MPSWITDYFAPMSQAPAWLWAVIVAAVVVIWFVPTGVAVFRNRTWLRPIALLNVPGGMSWIVWTALIVWAASGKGPPPNLAGDARKGWLWIGIGAAVLAAAVIWHFTTGSTA